MQTPAFGAARPATPAFGGAATPAFGAPQSNPTRLNSSGIILLCFYGSSCVCRLGYDRRPSISSPVAHHRIHAPSVTLTHPGACQGRGIQAAASPLPPCQPPAADPPPYNQHPASTHPSTPRPAMRTRAPPDNLSKNTTLLCSAGRSCANNGEGAHNNPETRRLLVTHRPTPKCHLSRCPQSPYASPSASP
eukprot:610302-Prorocentrum_minimum.AAC.1